MSVLFSGLVHVTGDNDVGKTTFALECGAPPEKMVFIDDDVKGRGVVNQLAEKGHKFAIYHDLISETKGMKEIQFHEHCMKIVQEILEYDGEIEAVVWDTWSRFEQSFKPIVTKSPSKFKDFWSPMGVIKGGEEWLESQRYSTEIMNRILGKSKLLILVTHLKPYRVGTKEIPGKSIPRCQAPVIEKSTLRLWLRQNPNGRPVPIGLVLKRLSDRRVTDRGIRTMNILPRRIVPLDDEQSLWDVIARYWAEPVGDRIPTEIETPDEYELSILEGTLTKDQKVSLELVLAELQSGTSDEIVTQDEDDPIITEIKEYRKEHPNASNSEIVKAVTGATMALVLKSKAK